MRLLLDQNLSPRLTGKVGDLFPQILHVQHIGLALEPDEIIWEYAKENDYVIVSKDNDFNERSLLYGFPPKVIYIKKGNCSTEDIETILRTHLNSIKDLISSEANGLLILA